MQTSKSQQDIWRCGHLQKKLLLAAIDMVDANSSTGGYVVYSTCSVCVEEDEVIVNYALRNRHVKVGQPGWRKMAPHRPTGCAAAYHTTSMILLCFY